MTTTSTTTGSRVARIAATAEQVRLVRLVLSIVAAPLYVVGALVAVLWLAVRWMYAATLVGFRDLTDRAMPPSGDR